MKKYSVIVLSILLIGCSSNPKITEVGPGVILSEKQLLTKEEVKKQETKDDVLTGTGGGAAVGAGTGAVVGAGTGAVFGGVFALAIGTAVCTIVTLGLGIVPCVAAMGGVAAVGVGTGALMGAGAGALIGAGSGALVGAGGSYIYASTKDVDKIKGKYQFEVLEDGKSSPITFEQFTDVEYASGDKVDIYQSEYKDVKTYFIKQLDQDSNEDTRIEKD
ncbi:hypothetical protein [Francisella salimarina]|uniref:Glycine zipper domain-containing protein n=1 Tax=Francisella salimarina TaxID=2599927 RepID=A0AAJ4NPJ2_9GAMM|nr:hypothetical protein [Francisella salimarina]QWU99426.1 hypothetical protein KQR59_00650 [Francisella salimarina]